MKVIITKNYEEMSERAAEVMLGVVKQNPQAVLGLANGLFQSAHSQSG